MRKDDLSQYEEALLQWKKQGKSNDEIIALLSLHYGLQVTDGQLRGWWHRRSLSLRLQSDILNFLRQSPATEEEVMEQFRETSYASHWGGGYARNVKDQIAHLLEMGYITYSTKTGKYSTIVAETVEIPEFGVTTHTFAKKDITKFAVVSDTHLVSKYECLDELHDFYRRAADWGAEVVLHAGDILDGYRVYPGHQRESKIPLDVAEHMEYFIEHYPRFPKTIAILGNHDHSYAKKAAFDILPQFKDLPWIDVLGYYHGRVDLGGLLVDLHHGDAGSAYAISYKLQKYVESYTSGNKPNLLFVGHYHTAGWISFRNVEAFHAGCFQRDTLYTRRKRLVPAIGGYFIKVIAKPREGVHKHEALGIASLRYHWLPYYK